MFNYSMSPVFAKNMYFVDKFCEEKCGICKRANGFCKKHCKQRKRLISESERIFSEDRLRNRLRFINQKHKMK